MLFIPSTKLTKTRGISSLEWLVKISNSSSKLSPFSLYFHLTKSITRFVYVAIVPSPFGVWLHPPLFSMNKKLGLGLGFNWPEKKKLKLMVISKMQMIIGAWQLQSLGSQESDMTWQLNHHHNAKGLHRWLNGKRICLPMQEMQIQSLCQKDSRRRKWQFTQVLSPGKSHGQRNMPGYSPFCCRRVGHNLVTKQQRSYWDTNDHHTQKVILEWWNINVYIKVNEEMKVNFRII